MGNTSKRGDKHPRSDFLTSTTSLAQCSPSCRRVPVGLQEKKYIPHSTSITHEPFLWFPCLAEVNKTLEAAVGYFHCFSKSLNHMRTDV